MKKKTINKRPPKQEIKRTPLFWEVNGHEDLEDLSSSSMNDDTIPSIHHKSKHKNEENL